MSFLLQTALSEAAGGAVAGIVADSVLYATDSAKIRAQSNTVSSRGGVRLLFRGMIPTILLGSVPVFGSFFFVYAPLRDSLQDQGYHSLLPIASAVCAVPATVIGVPADVLKKRLVLGIDPNIQMAVAHLTAKGGGWQGLFVGWHVNLIRDLPFAAVKVGLYEWFVYQWKNAFHHHYFPMAATELTIPMSFNTTTREISSVGAACCGVASGAACAVITCPLDVVNTRIKAGNVQSHSIGRVAIDICQKEGIPALFRGIWMRSVVLGLGSFIFWPIQRYVSQALQPNGAIPLGFASH